MGSLRFLLIQLSALLEYRTDSIRCLEDRALTLRQDVTNLFLFCSLMDVQDQENFYKVQTSSLMGHLFMLTKSSSS